MQPGPPSPLLIKIFASSRKRMRTVLSKNGA
jgi:hypothetical protein